MDDPAWLVPVALVLALCLVLGGGAVAGYFADVVLQVVSIPLLLAGLWRLRTDDPTQRSALLFCGGLVLVPLFQLIPLPPGLWTLLPWRGVSVTSLDLAGQDLGWRPMTVSPHATWLVLVSLIPPLAVFIAVLQLSHSDRRVLVLVVLALGIVASFVGLLQVALGPSGGVVDFGPTSPGEATGFFANRNHFAALLYVLLLFSSVWAIESTSSLQVGPTDKVDPAAFVRIVVCFTVVVVFLGAELMARSRAGLGLTIVALLGIAALASSTAQTTQGQQVRASRLIGAAVGLVVLFGAQFALYRAMERFATDPLGDARLVFARRTWDAAVAFLPFGSGLGTFVPVYQAFEKPPDALLDTYANRAHNDVLEVVLETGVAGVLLMVLFAVWLIRNLWRVWGTKEKLKGSDGLLARAASFALVLLAAHSLVDYPLRTTALMAITALACALLIRPPGADETEEDLVEHPICDAVPVRVPWTEPQPSWRSETLPSKSPLAWPEAQSSEPQAGTTTKSPHSADLWDASWPAEWQTGAPSREGTSKDAKEE